MTWCVGATRVHGTVYLTTLDHSLGLRGATNQSHLFRPGVGSTSTRIQVEGWWGSWQDVVFGLLLSTDQTKPARLCYAAREEALA